MRTRRRRPLKSQLAAIGYSAKDITYLAVSHNHADHTANANDYAASTWLVQRAEHDVMFGDEARKQANFANYSALEHSKTVLLDGDHDVFGDGTVMLISTPGHTPGHESLLVTLKKTGPVILTGDLYHYAAERSLKKVPNMDNKEQTTASRANIDQLLTQTGAQLWIQHDIVANAKLKNHRSSTSEQLRRERMSHSRAQRDDGLNAGRAASWKIRRQQGHSGESHRYRAYVTGLHRADAVEQRRHHGRHQHGSAQTDRDADEREHKPTPNKQAAHIADLRAESHADADLVGPLRGDV